MNLFTLAGIVGILVILFGVVMAAISVVLSRAVVENELAMEQEKTSVNPALTLGFEIPVDADVPDQIAAARRLAARQAAALPRGANMRIGRLGAETTEGAGDALEQDPLTAVKIAAFHTWQGAKVGPPPGLSTLNVYDAETLDYKGGSGPVQEAGRSGTGQGLSLH